MHRKKILFFIDTLEGGGAEKVLKEIVNHLDDTKYEITVQTIYNGGIYKEQLSHNIKYKSIFNKSNIWFRRFIKYIVRIIPARYLYSYTIKEEYDTEIAFLENIATKVISGSTSKARKIAWIHADIENYPSTRRLFITKKRLTQAYKKMDRIVCISEHVKKIFMEYTKICKSVVTIYNPINQEEIIQQSKENVKKVFSNSNFTICSVGRLNIEKGYDRLLRVVNKLNRNISINLFIIGEGGEKQKLQEYIMQNQLEKNIKLLGFKKNPYCYMKQANLFVSSSLSEGFSLAVAEAMILNIPIMSTNTAGPTEILQNGKYGLLVDNTEDEIYKGLKRIIEDKKTYKMLKQMVKERTDFLELKVIIEQIESIL